MNKIARLNKIVYKLKKLSQSILKLNNYIKVDKKIY